MNGELDIGSVGRRRRTYLTPTVAGLALLFTLLDAVKPLHIDDTAYYAFARHLAQHPLDPYGGTVMWYDRPDPALEILAPPVLPYWWAAAIRLFGERPFFWKLWLFPFAWLFVGSLNTLFERVARGLQTPLLLLTVVSPTFLPSFNLMLDIPALALGLAAVLLFMRAVDTASWPSALAAGLVAGLAMETKYTGFLAPVTMLLYALTGPRTRGRRRSAVLGRDLLLWLVACGMAAALFAGTEWLIARAYGTSHFVFHVREQEEPLLKRMAAAAQTLLPLTGGVAPAVALLGLAAKGYTRRVLAGLAGLMILGYAAIALIDADFHGRLALNGDLLHLGPWKLSFSLEEAWFTVWGIGLWIVLAAVAWRLLRVGDRGLLRPHLWRRHRVEWFLTLWLGLELGGYFALSTFPAVRRVMGIVVVATLLVGRLASLSCRQRGHLSVWAIVACGMMMGLGFAAVDWYEARAREEAAKAAAAAVRRRDPQAVIWYAGHWGFQYYADRLGMKPVVAGDSELGPGDWLVVPDDSIHHQKLALEHAPVRAEEEISVSDRVPYATVWCFYGTNTGAPLEHHEGSRVRLQLYRVSRAFVPQAPEAAK